MIIPEESECSPFELSGEVRWNRREEEGDIIMGILIGSFSTVEGEKQYASLLARFTKDKGDG